MSTVGVQELVMWLGILDGGSDSYCQLADLKTCKIIRPGDINTTDYSGQWFTLVKKECLNS